LPILEQDALAFHKTPEENRIRFQEITHKILSLLDDEELLKPLRDIHFDTALANFLPIEPIVAISLGLQPVWLMANLPNPMFSLLANLPSQSNIDFPLFIPQMSQKWQELEP
jgi:hypothetical protein